MPELIDQFGRRINYLRLSVTDHCNLNCFYCRKDNLTNCDEQKKYLDKQDFIKIVQAATEIGIKKVRLTGGEPLLSPEIVEIVRDVASIPAIKDLSMTTNAVLLPRYAHLLADAGLNRVNISLDSLRESNFSHITNGGVLSYALEGIDAALDANLTPIKLNVVLLKGINDHEIGDFARVTLKKNLHVRFIEYMPVSSELEQWENYFLSLEKVKEVCLQIGNLIPAESEHGGGPARYFRLQGGTGKIGFITPLSSHFCGKCNRIRVTADGKIKPCLFSASEVDLSFALSQSNAVELIKEAFFLAMRLKSDPQVGGRNSEERARQFRGYRKMSEIGG